MTKVVPDVFDAEDLYPQRASTAIVIHWRFASDPQALVGQTITLRSGSRVRVREVVEAFGGIDAEGQSLTLLADRV